MHANKSGIIFFFAAVLILNVLLINYFHNRAWYPQDAGAFAHVAERLAGGEKASQGVEDVHPGYLNFINAWALTIWGKDFVSMNYPLMAVALIQSILIFFCFARKGPWPAFLAALVPGILGVFQFINPNHHWYALFLTILLACLLTSPPKEGKGRRFLAGMIIASIFLFRQLTGVFVLIGVLAFFLYEARAKDPLTLPGKQRLASWLLLLMSLGLIFYFLRITNLTGFILFGLGPLTVLWWARSNVQVSNQALGHVLFQFFSGIGFGFIPIVIYHALHHDVAQWLKNTFFSSIAVLNQAFLPGEDYFKIIFCGFYEIIRPESWTIFLNGLFWFILPLTGLVNLIMLIRRLQAIPAVNAHELAIPFIGVFYGLVALHYQIPAYLFFSVALSVLGILWMGAASSAAKRVCICAVTILLLAVGLCFHAGQSLNRFFLRGEKTPLVFAGKDIPRLSLWVDGNDFIIYRETMKFIAQNTTPRDPIFVVPNDAEIYFLADRRNPYRFFSTDHGIHDDMGVDAIINSIRENPPLLVIDRPEDKRHTLLSKTIMHFIVRHYTHVRTIGPFKMYQLPGN